MRVIIDIEDNKKGKSFIEFIKKLPFIKFQVKDNAKKKRKGELNELFGIWEKRDITKESLRENAWR
jgi:hypothetical protein